MRSTPTRPTVDTLTGLLALRAQESPNRIAYGFLADGETLSDEITYGGLERRAHAIAAWLRSAAAPGSRVLLLFPPGLGYIEAFFGCLYAGMVAVPAYPPRLNRPTERITTIVADAGATIALAETRILDGLRQRIVQTPLLASLRWQDTSELGAAWADQWQPAPITPDHVAFLQYTSGSTGLPKGVVLRHGNLMHNLAVIRRGFQMNEDECGVFWLPSYHDMGLIGGILEPMYVRGRSYLMAPADFLQQPLRWLKAISRFQATISGAPNFAYQLCVDRSSPADRADLDLSRWKVAFCGAEPIQAAVMEQFAATFAPHGFDANALYPCYGMAENTLIATGGEGPQGVRTLHVKRDALAQNTVEPAAAAAAGDDDVQTVVSCGVPLGDQELLIVDPDTLRPQPDDRVGEIWIRGDSVADGYWQAPAATAASFNARPAGGDRGGYLRTGDLGFLHQGQLYITGRRKDLIIIRGRNYYPTDIEKTVESSHPAFEPGMGAAFSITVDDAEALAIAFEIRRSHRRADFDAVIDAARRAVAEAHAIRPAAVILLRPLTIPKTTSGKIQRFACRDAFLNGELRTVAEWRQGDAAERPTSDSSLPPTADGAPSAATIAAWLIDRIAVQLKMPAAELPGDQPLAALGLDSVQLVDLTGQLEAWLDRRVPPTLVWDYPTIDALAAHLAGEAPTTTEQTPSATPHGGPIAVVGMACRFPGAADVDAFWRLLLGGHDAVDRVPADRWDAAAYHAADPAAPGRTVAAAGGFLPAIDRFDADFFGISPREAARMDPQQRLLLEVAHTALEDAGIVAADLAGSATGCYVGISSSDYARLQYGRPEWIDAYAGTGNAHSIAANRLSYWLDLRGPSLALDTACSSALVAVHQAIRALRGGETDLALAGGVNVLATPDLSIAFSQARMLAPDGRCKPFDADADGYGRGEGCGVVVLKRLADAERDGDRVLAVLHGSAVNQDGRSNGLTAPNGLAQQAVVRAALADAGVEPGAIGYVEAHGTGTPLGDPIEMAALAAVFADASSDRPLHVGAVKSNIGHLEAAAGIAGLIKTILTVRHGRVPPNLHFETLNPHIDLPAAFRLPRQTADWPAESRLAGVSSFGFGGTNAHVIVGAPPVTAMTPVAAERPVHVITVSADYPDGVATLARAYATAARTQPVADIAYSANTGRTHRPWRAAAVVQDIAALDAWAAAVTPHRAPAAAARVGFLFSGQGTQAAGMGAELWETAPVYREALEACDALLDALWPHSLIDLLRRGTADQLRQTAVAQPVLFSLQVALTRLWASWGITPDVVMGHSVGELAAAWAAGVYTLPDALRLIVARGEAMQACPPGDMAAVSADPADVAFALEGVPTVTLAAINGPRRCVLSGESQALTDVLARLAARGIGARPLAVSHAFHSPLMDAALDPLLQTANVLTARAPAVPLISNVDGQRLRDRPATDHWATHARAPVQFAAGMEAAAALADTFIEIGPHDTLLSLGRRTVRRDGARWLPSLKRDSAAWPVIARSLAELYAAGAAVDWAGFDAPYPRRRVSLPPYPFRRERHWFTPPTAMAPVIANAAGSQPEAAVQRLDAALPLFNATVDAVDAASIERALTAIGAALGEPPLAPVDIHVDATGGGPGTVQFVLDGEHAPIQVRLFRRRDDGWTACGTARLEAVPAAIDETSEDPGPVADWSDRLRRLAAGVLGFDPARLDPARTLDQYGFDSLMALELHGAIEAQLGRSLPIAALLDAPSVADLAARLETLSADDALPPIAPLHGPEATAPLSADQQALWFLRRLLPPDVSFNVAGAVEVEGDLDDDRLNGALAQLIARHPILRTTFHDVDGTPMQTVLPAAAVRVVSVDAAGWDDAAVDAYLQTHAWATFDLAAPPALRLHRLRRGSAADIVLLALDHLVTDFWSVSVLLHEIVALYEAPDAALPAPPVQPADAVGWAATLRDGPHGDRLRAYWQTQLAVPPPPLDLPTDRPRPAQPDFRGDTAWRRLDPALTGRVHALAQRRHTTTATVLQTAFHLLLHRYTRADDLLVGTALAGRDRLELAGVLGYFVNPVAIRSQIDGATTFDDLLAQMTATLRGAMSHQHMPLSQTAAMVDRPRDANRPPLFETLFIMQQAPRLAGETDSGRSALALGLPGARLTLFGDDEPLTLTLRPLHGQPAQFDLTLMAADSGDALAAALHYSTALFERATAERLLAHFEQLLTAALDAPATPVTALPLLTAEEQQQHAQWNATSVAHPPTTLPALVAAQAARTPNATAVIGAGGRRTYAAVMRRAESIAAELRRYGVRRGDRVGAYLTRSADLPAALIGIHLAGAAYVPLDPDFPAARLALMLEDSAPVVCITDAPADQRPAATWLELADVPEHPVGSNGVAAEMPAVDDLAYLIYTSGSTGRPKGVAIPHGALTNFLLALRDRPGLRADDVLAAVTTLSFDIAALELFLPLITGATVVVVPRATAVDGSALAATLATHGATVMQATPATWRLLLEAGWRGPLRQVLCGGEALPGDLAAALRTVSPAVWNMYGPTETTIWSTVHRVTEADGAADGALPIGRPIDNTQVYVLDDAGQPVPVGVPGQLAIGGAGVARGYWNRPEQTEARFVEREGARVYLTGDLARRRADGTLIFLGRADDQVKIRGFRIELGDIEAALTAHPAVRQAVVVVHERQAGQPALVGFVRPHAEGHANGHHDRLPLEPLREHLRATLPAYMVPAQLVAVDDYPLTPNGKIDRRALARRVEDVPLAAAAYVAPRTPLEAQLAALCAELLDLERVGVTDDFFALGGNSLLASRLLYQARTQLHVDIPLRRLFAEPTIAGLAALLTDPGRAAGLETAPSADALLADAVLDPAIVADGLAPATATAPPLLTGATGFVGAFLLRDLLDAAGGPVYCLVRAADETAALDRLRRNLAQYDLWRDGDAARIRPVPGDLAAANLGLDQPAFEQLAATVGPIYHNGALVNFIYPYTAHKAANVDGTHAILRLSTTATLKPVHFVSTLSVFHTGAHDDGAVIGEDVDLVAHGVPFGGYAQSKWVAEALLRAAEARGLPVTVYRPGLVTGPAGGGRPNMSDMLSTLAQASLHMGCVPDLDILLDLVPVDYVSQAIVALSRRASPAGKLYNLCNPSPARYADALSWLADAIGEMETVSFAAWRAELESSVADGLVGDDVALFLPLLTEVDAAQVYMPRFACINVLRDLAGSHVSCPPVDAQLLTNYLPHFLPIGTESALESSNSRFVDSDIIWSHRQHHG